MTTVETNEAATPPTPSACLMPNARDSMMKTINQPTSLPYPTPPYATLACYPTPGGSPTLTNLCLACPILPDPTPRAPPTLARLYLAYTILPYSTLPYHSLAYHSLPYPTPYSTLPCPILPYPAPPYLTLPYPSRYKPPPHAAACFTTGICWCYL